MSAHTISIISGCAYAVMLIIMLSGFKEQPSPPSQPN